ncbi:Clp amino terminal domain-containing protein, pathogenicity island component [Lentzea xinjiangensis]|uniref:Clp amino terminal domain-containing protein, pathogenicity island component n=1 Tax=Lentzea xinjiangensis TaxID=402600 RepID=A0A1H9UG01_9PSEU|nr:Clp protease N-terminal domain-containing protein [Lentzea xinjiangensis]SES08097.1 Clp amino terminal domain-containing protein, pathogenicity island component [Lentzea xinjiangensis]
MFQGEHPELGRVVREALMSARALGHPRTGAEHLLLALTLDNGTVAAILGRHGVTTAVVERAARAAEPSGAGAAADREALAVLGVELDALARRAGIALLDRAPAREPLLPLGAAAARQRCARLNPPLGLDAQAAYEASLRLALARREREHRQEHLALALLALDPGVAWALADVDLPALIGELAAAFPPPHRNPLLRAERRLGRRSRHRDIVRRYQHTTGRTATAGAALAAVIGG